MPDRNDMPSKSRAQSYSRSMRRKVLKAKYGKDWKDHQIILSKVLPIGIELIV